MQSKSGIDGWKRDGKQGGKRDYTPLKGKINAKKEDYWDFSNSERLLTSSLEYILLM